MEEVLIEEELISRPHLRELSLRRNAPSARRLVAQTTAYLGSSTGLVLADETWWIGALLLFNGAVQFGLFGLLHESCHNTAFTRRGLNQLGGWIAALAHPMSPALMRAFHFEHHRHTHQCARDPELGGAAFMVRWPRGVHWLVTVSGVPILLVRSVWSFFAALAPSNADWAWTRVLPFVREEERRRVGWEARLLMTIHGAIVLTAVFAVPALWRVYAGMALGHMFLSWYVTCEHRGLPEEGTVLERTRTLLVPRWVRWLLWNMLYHAEHHAWPAVPWHALPRLHELAREHLVNVERPLCLHLRGGQARPRAS